MNAAITKIEAPVVKKRPGRPPKAAAKTPDAVTNPAVGCSARSHQMITLLAEIRGVSRSTVLDDMVAKYFA